MKPNHYVLAHALEQEAAQRPHAAAELRRIAQGLIEYPTSQLRVPEALQLLGVDAAELPPEVWLPSAARPSVVESVRSLQAAIAELSEGWDDGNDLRRLIALRKVRWAATMLIAGMEENIFLQYNKRIIDNGGRVAGIISAQGDKRQGRRPPRGIVQTQDLKREAKHEQ